MKAVIVLALLGVALPAAGVAQTRSVRDTATAYGARLNAKGQPANLNRNRVENRIDSRINNRIALRIERYRPSISGSPTTAFHDVQSDKSRAAPVITFMPQQFDP